MATSREKAENSNSENEDGDEEHVDDITKTAVEVVPSTEEAETSLAGNGDGVESEREEPTPPTVKPAKSCEEPKNSCEKECTNTSPPCLNQTTVSHSTRVNTPVVSVHSRCILFRTLGRRSFYAPPCNRAIRDYFHQFGRIVAFKKSPDHTSGHVVFATIHQAGNALSAFSHCVDGCDLKLKSARHEPFIIPKRLLAKSECIAFELFSSETNGVRPYKPAFESYFRTFGMVVAFKMNGLDMTGFVVYENIDDAQRALLNHDSEVYGFGLKVIPATHDLSEDCRYNKGVMLYSRKPFLLSSTLGFQAMTRRSRAPCPSRRDLRNHFKKFGPVEHLYLHPVHDRGSVQYTHLRDAENAFLARYHFVDDCELKLFDTPFDC